MTSLAIWELPMAGGWISSHPWWDWESPLAVCHRRFSELHDRCATVKKIRSGSLGWISTRCQDQLQVLKWKRVQKWKQGPFRKAAAFQSMLTEQIVSSTISASSDKSVRRLILLRHAKSSWQDRSIKDHERPLSRRGRQAAANIADKLQQCDGWEPQLILCSDSTRTRETFEIMQQQIDDFLDGDVRYFSSFYSVAALDGQTVQHLQQIICECSKDLNATTIMCMGHNRGWEEAASLLSGGKVELKTANAALLETKGRSWEEAFATGLGGWKLVGVLKPDPSVVEGAVQ